MALLPDRSPPFQVPIPSQRLSEQLIVMLLGLAAAVPILVIGAIVLVFVHQSWLFFQEVPFLHFLTDTQWSPLFFNPKYGIGVLISGTLVVTAIAMLFAIPVGILSAIYLSEYAPSHFKAVIRPLLVSLSGVPTIVYGYFALLLVTPYLQQFIPGLLVFNGLSAGLVTGLLIIPIIAALSEDALTSVEATHRQAAYACGFTRLETIRTILLPQAFPGIMASITLAASRALGETMIAAIAAGQTPTFTLSPLVPIETMTAFIVQVSLGDVPTDSLLFHTIFTVGMMLFLITLALNSAGQWLVRQHHQSMAGKKLPIADTERDLPTAESNVSAIANHAFFRPHAFAAQLQQRYWCERLFALAGLLAALIAPAFLGILTLVTIRLGLAQLNWEFLTHFTSSNPEKAGILAGLAGTFWLLGLTAILAIPLGIAAAIYLEEYMPDGFWSQLIEVNLANATAVPGVLYGLLGLAVFAENLRWLTGGSSILAAALMMTLLVLPLLITAARLPLRQVPAAMKRGGYAIGMSRWQVIWYIVLPAARPGMLTGLLLTASRVIGEASPLIAIGAIEFVTFVPTPTLAGIQSPFTTLTTQIFYWLSRPQPVFQEKAAAAVMVLGALVLGMNLLASCIRDRLEKVT